MGRSGRFMGVPSSSANRRKPCSKPTKVRPPLTPGEGSTHHSCGCCLRKTSSSRKLEGLAVAMPRSPLPKSPAPAPRVSRTRSAWYLRALGGGAAAARPSDSPFDRSGRPAVRSQGAHHALAERGTSRPACPNGPGGYFVFQDSRCALFAGAGQGRSDEEHGCSVSPRTNRVRLRDKTDSLFAQPSPAPPARPLGALPPCAP